MGDTLTNPALAAILRRVAEEGSSAFHEGEIAEDLVARVQSHPQRPGEMSLEDLSGYEPVEREPICTPGRSGKCVASRRRRRAISPSCKSSVFSISSR